MLMLLSARFKSLGEQRRKGNDILKKRVKTFFCEKNKKWEYIIKLLCFPLRTPPRVKLTWCFKLALSLLQATAHCIT